jgi:hypothetical protein
MDNKNKKVSKGLIVIAVITCIIAITVWGFLITTFILSKDDAETFKSDVEAVTIESEEAEVVVEEGKSSEKIDEEFNEKIELAEKAYNNKDYDLAIKHVEEAINIKDDERAKELREKYSKAKNDTIQANADSLLQNIDKRYDDMQDITWYNPKGEKWYYVNNNTVNFALYTYLGEKDNKYNIRLVTGFAREDWVFMEEITVKADSDRFNIDFDVLGDRKGKVVDGGIGEWIDIEVDDTLLYNLKKIADAQEAKIRFTGDTAYSECVLNSTQKKQLKTIIDYYELVR